MENIAKRLNTYITARPFDSGDSDCETNSLRGEAYRVPSATRFLQKILAFLLYIIYNPIIKAKTGEFVLQAERK